MTKLPIRLCYGRPAQYRLTITRDGPGEKMIVDVIEVSTNRHRTLVCDRPQEVALAALLGNAGMYPPVGWHRVVYPEESESPTQIRRT
jgi:hypothetical protein